MKKDLPFESVFYDATRLAKKIPQSDYLPKGYYPILDQGKKYISGYYNDNLGLFSDVPAIIFGDHTRIIKFITSPCFIGADGVKLLKFKTKDNPKYLYYALQSLKIPNTGYNRHFRLLKEAKIRICPKNIQEKIVLILDKIKSIIENKNRQIENIDIIAKSRFIEMFGDVKESRPLCELVEFLSRGKAPKYVGGSSVKVINQACIYWDQIKYENIKFNDENRISNDAIIYDYDLLINSTGTGTLGRCNMFTRKDRSTYVADSHVTIIRVKSDLINSYYLKSFFSLVYTQNELYRKCVNGSTNQIELSKEKLLKFKIKTPPINMQLEYSYFVQQLDKSKFRMKMCLKIMSFIRHL